MERETLWWPSTDVIGVGDQCEWAPYGHPHWPGAHGWCEVVDVVVVDGDETIIIGVQSVHPNGDPLGGETIFWHEEAEVRAMAQLWHRPGVMNECTPHRFTTANPRRRPPTCAETRVQRSLESRLPTAARRGAGR